MSGFAIRYPFFIIMLCLIVLVVGVTTVARMPVDLVSRHQYSSRRRSHVLFGHAARADRNRYHQSVRAIFHAGQRHRSHRVAIAAGRQPDQGLFPAGDESGCRRERGSRIWPWRNCADLPPGTLPPVVLKFDASSLPVCLITLKGEGLNETQLHDLGAIQRSATRWRMCRGHRCRSRLEGSTGRSRCTSIR